MAPPGGPWLVTVMGHSLCTSLGARLLGGQVLLANRVGHDCLTPCLLLGGGLLLLRLEGARMLLRRLEGLFEGKLFEAGTWQPAGRLAAGRVSPWRSRQPT